MERVISVAEALPHRGEAAEPPDMPETENAVPSGVQRSGSGLRETEDAYHRVVVCDGRYRIIECRDRLQWLIQSRQGEQWRSIHFCRWRVTLERLCRSWSDDAHAVIRALPQGIEEAGR